MPKRNNHAQFSIECGATTDSFDNLKKQCQAEAEKLLSTIDLSTQKQLLLLSGPQIFQS